MEAVIFSVLGIGLVAGVIWAAKTKHSDTDRDTNIADKVKELPKVFESAKNSIDIATDFDKGFFTNKKVKAAFVRAMGNGVTIRILTEGKPTDWFEAQERLSNVIIKRVKELPRHLMVVDERHFRLEVKHKRGQFGKGHDRAMLFFDFPIAGQRYSKEFDTLWTRST